MQTLGHCWLNVGPTSQTVAQRWDNIGSIFTGRSSKCKRSAICWLMADWRYRHSTIVGFFIPWCRILWRGIWVNISRLEALRYCSTLILSLRRYHSCSILLSLLLDRFFNTVQLFVLYFDMFFKLASLLFNTCCSIGPYFAVYRAVSSNSDNVEATWVLSSNAMLSSRQILTLIPLHMIVADLSVNS